MAIFRIKHNDFEKSFNANTPDTLESNEWEDTTRLAEQGWDNRYDYEAQILREIIAEANAKTILEIGSGPGILSQKIQKLLPEPISYDLVDKAFAKKYFEDNKFVGRFFCKDISTDLDCTDLMTAYDLIICNDTLEHLLAPSNMLRRIRGLMIPASIFFISIPNWRMAHQFIYRGLWDYDNLMYFMYSHGFQVDNIYPSLLKTPYYPKLDSEQSMPDELIQSWNFYLVCSLKK